MMSSSELGFPPRSVATDVAGALSRDVFDIFSKGQMAMCCLMLHNISDFSVTVAEVDTG